MASRLYYSEATSRHLSLFDQGEEWQDRPGPAPEKIQTAPLVSSKLTTSLELYRDEHGVSGKGILPQNALIGMTIDTYCPLLAGPREEEIDDKNAETLARIMREVDSVRLAHHRDGKDALVYENVNAPQSTLILGGQGSGTSHTLCCSLENALVKSCLTGEIEAPLTGLVLRYDKFSGSHTMQACEAAYLHSEGIKIRVLVSPASYERMKQVYAALLDIPADENTLELVPLKFEEKHLTLGMVKSFMAFGVDGGTPPYMAAIARVLQQMAAQRRKFSFMDFKAGLNRAGWGPGRSMSLDMRLHLLESFMDYDNTPRLVDLSPVQARGMNPREWARIQAKMAPVYMMIPRRARPENVCWKFEKETLTIVDLSCPFVKENDACALFDICVGIFLRSSQDTGKIIALDEAHKFLTNKTREATALTETMKLIVRQQRHVGTRVVITAQEPTLSPGILSLCDVLIVHRLASTAWFDMLRGRLAGPTMGAFNAQDSVQIEERIFSQIVDLKLGEALVFAPRAILDVDYEVMTASEAESVSSEEEDGDDEEIPEEERVVVEAPIPQENEDGESYYSYPENTASPSIPTGPDMRLKTVKPIELGSNYIKMKIRQRVSTDGGQTLFATR